ncbi:MAG: hypothetical protein WCY89_02305 [Flavobacteriaceae bacterium]
MKLNNEQIQKINHILLREERIYDKLVRLELVDHIASVLEEKDLSFEESFTEYWHSSEKVLLITNAKKQIENKKEQVEGYFWRQFLNPIHLLVIAVLFFGLKSLSTQIETFEHFVKGSIIVLMSLVFVLFLSIKFFSKRNYYYFKSFLGSVSIFYVVSLQLSNFWRNKITESLPYVNIFLVYISLIIVSFWFFYKTYRYSLTIDSVKKISS